MSHAITAEFLREEQKKYFTFINLAFLMTALTGIELVLIYLPFNPHLIFWSLLILSLVKFVGVIFWFMHLIYDKRFYTWAFLFGMILATGIYAALLLLFSAQKVDQEVLDLGMVPVYCVWMQLT